MPQEPISPHNRGLPLKKTRLYLWSSHQTISKRYMPHRYLPLYSQNWGKSNQNSNKMKPLEISFPSLISFATPNTQKDDKTRHYLTPTNIKRPPPFYGLHRVHEPNICLWPIALACGWLTNQLLNYITHFIQTLTEILPSCIQGSEHFLQLLESLPPLFKNVIVVTADVTPLYTNIPHKECLESVLH